MLTEERGLAVRLLAEGGKSKGDSGGSQLAKEKDLLWKTSGVSDDCVQWGCGFLEEGFLAGFAPASLSLRPHGLEADDVIAGPVFGGTGVP